MVRLVILFLAATIANAQEAPVLIREGSSPQIAVDTRGTIRMVFGRSDSIFVVTSTDDARSFSAAAVVGVVPGMHLGNTRGPTIASSANRSAILAIDTKGTLSVFELDHRANRWLRRPQPLNTADGSAPEGLGTVAADNADNFYFTWLDLRDERQNQIYFAKLAKGATGLPANRKIYSSPDGHVASAAGRQLPFPGGTWR